MCLSNLRALVVLGIIKNKGWKVLQTTRTPPRGRLIICFQSLHISKRESTVNTILGLERPLIEISLTLDNVFTTTAMYVGFN
jgi:hypothetical protein